MQGNAERVTVVARNFRTRLFCPRACRIYAVVRRGCSQRGHDGFVAIELIMRCIEDFLTMTAPHAAVVRCEQMRVQTENCFAVGTAGCQRHM